MITRIRKEFVMLLKSMRYVSWAKKRGVHEVSDYNYREPKGGV